MLILLSPSKTFAENGYKIPKPSTLPEHLDQAEKLVGKLKKMSAKKLSGLMKISDKLAIENHQRYQQWQRPFDQKNAKPACLFFRGDVYLGLEAESFKSKEFQFAQKHLRILSGLYGSLRPLDLIQPYRLEMGTSLKIGKSDNLYQFWDDQITKSINRSLQDQGDRWLINLASNEYYKSVKPKLLESEVITPAFKEEKNGSYKMISFFAKKARGRLASWIIRNRLSKVQDLNQFSEDGYRINRKLSTASQPVFTRKQA